MLLLHGQPGSARDWERVIAALGPGPNAIAIDRPGWDGSSRACGFYCNASAAVAALDAAGLKSATVVGYSLGGAIAAEIAAAYPDRVSRLVLIAPAANTASLVPLDRLLAAPVLGELAGAAGLATAGAVLAAPPVRRLIASELKVDARYLGGAARRLLMPGTWSSFVSEQRMLLSELPALEQSLAKIQAPTTIVIGTADRIVPPSSARKLARQIPGAKLLEIERANHMLLAQQAERLAEILLAQ